MKNINKFLLIVSITSAFCMFSNFSTCQTKDIKNIINKEWKVISIKGINLIEAKLENGYPKIIFGENEKLSGFTGCNIFSGSYTINYSSINLDPGTITKMMCYDNTELQLLSAFDQITMWKFSEDKLELLNKDNTILILVLVTGK